MSALIWSSLPDEYAARALADTVLSEGIIACANIVPEMQSIFIWNGKRGESRECGMLFKTDAALLDDAVARIEELHPYDTPAVLGWRCDTPGSATQAWLGELADKNR